MNKEEVKDIVENVWWDRFKMLLAAGSLLVAIQEFMKSLNKYDDRVRPCEYGTGDP